MNINTGIEPLDKRLGGIRAGGVYVMAGVPGSGKLVSMLQFLNAGLPGDGRVALLTGAPPEQVFDQASHWGFELKDAWKRGQLRLLGFSRDFEQLLLRAADPRDVFDELASMMGPDVERLGVDPGKALWETRAGTTLASRFIEWVELSQLTIWATLGSGIAGSASPAGEWVMQAASGVFEFERMTTGVRQLWIRRINPPSDLQRPLNLELVPGVGLQHSTGRLEGGGTDAPIGNERRLGLLKLADKIPSEIVGWAGKRYDVVELDDSLRLVTRLQDGDSFGVILVYLDRAHTEDAAEACRAVRPFTIAPIILACDDRLRASDRTAALDAGANDFLSDNFAMAELASRIERAAQSVRGLAPPRRSQEHAKDSVAAALFDASSFTEAVKTRLDAKDGSIFTLVLIQAPSVPEELLGDAMLQQVRGDMGDIAGIAAGGYGVVLQGARPQQADAFLGRLQHTLKNESVGADALDVRVFGSATDTEQIIELLIGKAGHASTMTSGS
ncbi:ATPase domain-containing protein [Gemmatimonadota bacterium]